MPEPVCLAVTLAVLQIVVPVLLKSADKKVRLDAETMERWRSSLMAFVEDHDGREGGKMLEDRMKQVRDIAYEIEDVLDEIMLHSPPYSFHKHYLTRKVHHQAHQMKHGFPVNRYSEKIKNINNRIRDIQSQLQAFPVRSGEGSSSSSRKSHRVSPLLVDPHDDMVGYEVERKALINVLKDGGPILVRVAVVGAGGSGKTTLVKNVYWDREIREQFECFAWLHMGRSRDFDVTELYCNLLKQLGLWKNSYPYDHDSLLLELREHVAKKRYLVVLDDIGGEIDVIWDYIQKAFPDTLEGSRIIVTTRVDVSSSRKQQIVTLKGLEMPQAWKLFCRKAFEDNNGECSPDLKDWAEKICKRCEGQPFAIVVVGGVLARKPNDPNEWERFHKNFECGSWKDSPNLKPILKTLLPDILDLDSNLKCCFLYFSIFPEDYSISRGRLIRLWVAEGFAMEKDGRTAEEVADGYLNLLIKRHLVHVTDWDFDGRPRNCRVLNFILMFIIQKCKDENFASIFNKENESQNQKIRRMSVHHDHNCDALLLKSDLSGVRSIFLMRLLGASVSDFNDDLRKMKLLRVFYYQDLGYHPPLTEFPKAITDLILIRHLSFRGTKIKTIPSSIKKLSYLETLDLKQTEVTELPREIAHLHNLCHLFVYKYCKEDYVVFDSVKGAIFHEGIKNLTRLQDLLLVKVDEKGTLLKELKELKELRKLGLMDLRTCHGRDLCAAVEEMRNLTTLDVCTNSTEEDLELEEMTKVPNTLRRVYLKGRLRRLPTWISSPSLVNIRKVALKWSKLQVDNPLERLERLPNLMELQLVDCYVGEELIFRASCFKKLKVLAIEEMEKVGRIVIEDGAMPDLKEMSLVKCLNVKMCPVGIEKLGKIEKLNLYEMDHKLVARVGKHGKDHAMVQHIPVLDLNSE